MRGILLSLLNQPATASLLRFVEAHPPAEAGTRDDPILPGTLPLGEQAVATYALSERRQRPVAFMMNYSVYEVDAAMNTVHLLRVGQYGREQGLRQLQWITEALPFLSRGSGLEGESTSPIERTDGRRALPDSQARALARHPQAEQHLADILAALEGSRSISEAEARKIIERLRREVLGAIQGWAEIPIAERPPEYFQLAHGASGALFQLHSRMRTLALPEAIRGALDTMIRQFNEVVGREGQRRSA